MKALLSQERCVKDLDEFWTANFDTIEKTDQIEILWNIFLIVLLEMLVKSKLPQNYKKKIKKIRKFKSK